MSKYTKKLKRLTPESVKRQIPRIGIFVFAGSSTHALGEFFNDMANTPSRWYTVASWLVELYSAFVIGLVVEQLKIATASIGGKDKITKAKKRMGWIMFSVYVAGVLPTIAVSITANTLEFGGGWEGGLLGSLFPLLCICSAVADVLPDVMAAKTKETQSGTEEDTSKPKQTSKQQFFAICESCGWFGTNGANKKKAYATARAAQCALNAHKCKEKSE